MSTISKKPWKRRLGVALAIAILAAWICYVAVFVYRLNYGGGEVLTPEVQQLASQELQEEWFAIYQHGNRTGYSHTEIRPWSEGYALTETV